MAVDIVLGMMYSFDVRPASIHGNESVFIWLDEHKNRQADPEWNLWAACLTNALHDLERYTDSKSKMKFRHALQWFLSDNEGVGTFRFVCDALGISHSYCRHKVKEHFRLTDADTN